MYQTRKVSSGFDLPYYADDEPPTVRAVPQAWPQQGQGSSRPSSHPGLVIGLGAALAFMMVIVLSLGLRQYSLEAAVTRQKAAAEAAAASAASLRAQEDARAEAARVADQARRAEEDARLAKERAVQEAQRGRELELSGLAGRMTALQIQLDSVTAESADYDTKVRAYMARHQDACIALFAGAAGGSAAFSNDKNISEEAKAIGGITAAAALLWALDHQDEVTSVSSELSKAVTEHESYASRIADLKDKIADVQGQIDGLKP